ncbi:MAG TPA: cyclodeaminase/cyclohydrolase family protein [Vicinamibacterales bacterium]
MLSAFSSTEPTPGGGSASALASAVGASLLMMVAGLPKTRTNAPEERAALQEASNRVAELRDRLSGAIDADTAAYDRVVAAYRLPKASPEEQAARQLAIQSALRAATDVPLDVMRWSAQALEQAIVIARHGLRSASSDIGVAAALLRAGSAGARLNVDINVGSVKDSSYADAVRAEVRELSTAIDSSGASVSAALSQS